MATPNGETSSKLPWTTCVMGCDLKESSEVTLLKCFHAICSDSCVDEFKSAIDRGQNVTTCVPCKSPKHAFKSSRKIVLANFFPRKQIIDVTKDPLLCDNCVSMPVAKAFCNLCDQFLCESCIKHHSDSKSTHNHSLEYENLEDRRREICKLETHFRSPLIYYCHKCDIKFCKVCACNHVGHVAFVFQREREDFDSKIIAVTNFIEKCNKAIEGLVDNHHTLTTDEWMVAKTYLARKCARLFENWQEEYRKREPDFKKVFDAMCTNIVRKIKCVKKARQFYQDFLVVASEISENRDDVAVVNFLRFCGKKDDGSIGDSWILNVDKHFQEMDGILEADCKFMKQEEFAEFKAEIEKIAEKCENLGRAVKLNGFNKIGKQLKLKTTANTEVEASSDELPMTIPGQSMRKRHKSVRFSEPITDVQKDDDDTADRHHHHDDNGKVVDVDTSTEKLSESENNREINGKENCNGDAHTATDIFPPEITQKPLEVEVSNDSNCGSDEAGSSIAKLNGVRSNNIEKLKVNKSMTMTQNPEAVIETPLLPENPHNHRRKLHMSAEDPEVAQVIVPENINGTAEKTKTAPVLSLPTDEAVFKTPLIRKPHKSVRLTGVSPLVTENINKQTLSQEAPKENIGTEAKNISTSKRKDHHDMEASGIGDTPRQSAETNGNATPSQLLDIYNFNSNDDIEVGNGIDTTHDGMAEEEVNLDQNKMGEFETRTRPRRSCGFRANPEMIYVPPTLGGNFGIGTVTMGQSLKKVMKKSSNGKVKLSKKVRKSIKKVKGQNQMESVDSNESGSGTKRPLTAPTDPEESEVTTGGTSSNPPKKIRRQSEQALENANIAAELESAPESSLEEAPSDSDYPLQLPEKMKLSGDLDDGESEDYCCICRDGRDDDDEDDIIICCDFCPKVYHPRCHIPVITEIPKDDEQWRCNYEITKESFDELIAQCNGQNNGDNENIENQVFELVEANKSHFQLACSFLMECHKIPEIPTVRWRFPQKYLEKYGKVPFHLNYLRKRLCLGEPKPFSSTEDMLKSFRQMFIQAFMIYTKKQKYRPDAFKCFTRFLNIVNDYYPQYKTMFSGILDD